MTETFSPLPFWREAEVVLLLSSPAHRYEGRPADGPREATVREVQDSIDIRAHLGVVGDRYFGQRAHVTASVTVMAAESVDHVASVLGLPAVPELAATRRNILLRGIPIDDLRGADFSIDTGQGPVVFRAHRPANPCAWMDVTLAPGAHRALRGRGGMRCEPLTDGTLTLGRALVRSSIELPAPTLF